MSIASFRRSSSAHSTRERYRVGAYDAPEVGVERMSQRCITSVRLWAERSERQKVADLLAPVYSWFIEGFETADLKDAKALLDGLA
jgi:predicted ATPase